MPGGNNSWTRPANKPQRAARKRQKARNAAIDNLKTRRDELLLSEDNPNEFRIEDAKLRKMMADIESASAEDRATMRQGVERAKQRKDNRYNYSTGGGIKAGYKYGGQAKKGYTYGGCVMAGRGGSYKGES